MSNKNGCAGTRLPRADDETVEEIVFLEHDEYQLVRRYVTDEDARDLADWLVGTGMRWGEASALQVQDLKLGGSPYPPQASQGRGRGEPRPLGEIAAEVEAAGRRRAAARYARLGLGLPALLEELTAAVPARSASAPRRSARASSSTIHA